jgi:hypothetical protein
MCEFVLVFEQYVSLKLLYIVIDTTSIAGRTACTIVRRTTYRMGTQNPHVRFTIVVTVFFFTKIIINLKIMQIYQYLIPKFKSRYSLHFFDPKRQLWQKIF